MTPFDYEMRLKGYRLTRYADDWVVTCRSRAEAQAALATAVRILKQLGVTLHNEKTRIVHVQYGFEFLGFKVKQGKRKLYLLSHKIRSGARSGTLYAVPSDRSIELFKDEIRRRTRRIIPLSTYDLIKYINPVIRVWDNYFCMSHVRTLFNRLDCWIIRRIWYQRYKLWRCIGWKRYPASKLYGEMGLVSLVSMIPSLLPRA